MKYLFPLFFLFVGLSAKSQTDFQTFFEQDYYTTETRANLVIIPPAKWYNWSAKIRLQGEGFPTIEQLSFLQKEILIPVALAPIADSSLVQVVIQIGAERFQTQTVIRKLPAKFNAVKINRRTGALIADDLPFFPAGFYSYSPVQETLAEEEVARGFNMISPYQQITKATLSDRIHYLDRCAALGMKVHYNLLSVAGGGGPREGRSDYEENQRLALLRAEVEAVKDHPALLGWYISDEPTGRNVQPEALQPTYDLIKSIDPYHPVSIVFMNPSRATEYKEVMDIVMADPYPIPNRPPNEVGEIIGKLKSAFRYDLPVWLVPQAFGGNEHWGREPTPGELRIMTWLGAVQGATGLQYFIRHGLSSFPKSTLTWDAASAAVQELQNLSPFLLEYETSELLKAVDKDLDARWYQKEGQLVLIVLNKNKIPKNFLLNTEGLKLPLSGKVLFEDRGIELRKNGRLQDIIEGYGRRVYWFDKKAEIPPNKIQNQNLLLDPSFEESLVPGTPAACYFKLRGDRGAHAQLDTRIAVDGRHSLRLTTPAYDNGLDVSLFPVQLKKGQAYALTFWAKARQPNKKLYARIGLGEERTFNLSSYWQSYQWVFTANGQEATRNSKTSIILSLLSKGVAWIDLVQLSPEPQIVYEKKPFAEYTEVKIVSAQTNNPAISINYTLDGSTPNITSRPYSGPVRVDYPMTFSASVTKNNQAYTNSTPIAVNMLQAQTIVYRFPYYDKYSAGGRGGLIDGEQGTVRFSDGRWQGWNKDHVDVTLDFGEEKAMQAIHLNFLSDHINWIYPPTSIKIHGSKNGKRYREIAQHELPSPIFDSQAQIKKVLLNLKNQSYRYLRVEALRPAALPEDHPSAGGNPFIFLDEVMVERGNLR